MTPATTITGLDLRMCNASSPIHQKISEEEKEEGEERGPMAGEIQRALRCQGGARNDAQSRRDKADTEGAEPAAPWSKAHSRRYFFRARTLTTRKANEKPERTARLVQISAQPPPRIMTSRMASALSYIIPNGNTVPIARSHGSMVSTDIPQMTSKFAEIVPGPHLQGNSVPIAAIR